jgi:hypothetical protein
MIMSANFADKIIRNKETGVLEKTGEKVPSKASGNDKGKREKFVELAESRTKTAIKAIRTIAKLGNRSAYDFGEADVKKIAGALNREVEALKARMLRSGGKESVDFSLD